MNDFGRQYPQQHASAGAGSRPAGPPARPPMPGLAAQGRPAPHPQQYSAQQFPARPGPARPQQGPVQQGPVQQGPRPPVPVQRRPIGPPPAQSSGPSWPAPAPMPPAPMPAAPAPADDPNAVPVRKRGKAGKIVGILVVAAALGGVGWVLATGPQQPVAAAVGECVTQTGTDDIAVVGCGEPSAQFTVAGKLENKTVIDASLFACSDFPDATSSYWQGVEGKPGTVLCLAPVKPAAPAKP